MYTSKGIAIINRALDLLALYKASTFGSEARADLIVALDNHHETMRAHLASYPRQAGDHEAFYARHADYVALMDQVLAAANNRDDDNYMWSWQAAAHKVNRARATFQDCQSISNEHAYATAKIAAWYIDHLPALAAMLTARHANGYAQTDYERGIAPRHLHGVFLAQDILFDHGLFHGEQF